jgi:coatomer protein complex subunit gamma
MLGMIQCENSDIVEEDRANTYVLLLISTFAGGISCIARASIYEFSIGVTLELKVRSPVRAICEILSNSIYHYYFFGIFFFFGFFWI